MTALPTLPTSSIRVPGTSGWPVVGETLAFLRDPLSFWADRFAGGKTAYRSQVFGEHHVSARSIAQTPPLG